MDPLFKNIWEVAKHLSQKGKVTTSTRTPFFIEKEILTSGVEDEDTEATPRNIIKHPENKPLAVIEKSALYVRESYEDLYDLIINQVDGNFKYKLLVTGTSGVGKSCFLIYLLIQLFHDFEDVTIILQSIQNEYFYCFQSSDFSVGSYDDFSAYFRSSKTWYLADGILSPKLVPAKTVVALSAKGVYKDEFQEFDKILVRQLYLPPWSLEELLVCQKHIFQNVPKDIILNLYDKVGGVPRYVLRRADDALQCCKDPRMPDEKDIIKRALGRVATALQQVKNFDDLILCVTEDAYYIQYSSRLVHRWPDPFYDSYYLQWASRYIYDNIQERLEKQSSNDLLERIQRMKNFPSARGI
ncbi:7411_t:CDS:2, partial [Ambispora gerdemannii]